MSASTTRLILVLGAITLFVLLFFANKTAPPLTESGKGKPKAAQAMDATLDVYLGMALKPLDIGLKKKLDVLVEQKQMDSLVVFWDKQKRPDLASFFSEKSAELDKNASKWFKAGNRYYYAVQFCQDKSEVPVLYQSAMRCFSKGLSMEPGNTDAKIMLASCYVEGTQDPMTGITKLKEVEKTDSNNVKLQLNFAFFSLKSGQYQKAIDRFNKVLAIDSNYIEAYLHLADVYEQQNEKEKTIKMLEKYASKTGDVTAKIEINKYIQQLKNQ